MDRVAFVTGVSSGIGYATAALLVERGYRAAVERASGRKVKNGSDPRDVAEAVYRALTAGSPRMRYPVGEAKTMSLLRRLVPAPMFSQSLRKQFGLKSEGL